MGEVLVEEFVGGQEYAVNGMVDRKHDFLITDVWRYDKRESHGIPNLYYQSIKVNTWKSPSGSWPPTRPRWSRRSSCAAPRCTWRSRSTRTAPA